MANAFKSMVEPPTAIKDEIVANLDPLKKWWSCVDFLFIFFPQMYRSTMNIYPAS